MQALRITATDVWTMAQTAWGEARGEGSAGIEAVLWTMRHRHTLHPRWTKYSLDAICRARFQYSAWNPGDGNRALIERLNLDDDVFCVCLTLAIGVLAGQRQDVVCGATHYYATGTREPRWAKGHAPVVIIGHHRFYANIA